MSDLDLTVTVSRSLLGLAPLELTDDFNYYLTRTFLGGQVTWERVRANSPWTDGDVTTSRRRGQVSESIIVEVLGDSPGELQSNQNALIGAFIQDTFTLDIAMADSHYAYRCESADYKLSWVPERFIAGQTQVELTVPRHPIPLIGVA